MIQDGIIEFTYISLYITVTKGASLILRNETENKGCHAKIDYGMQK